MPYGTNSGERYARTAHTVLQEGDSTPTSTIKHTGSYTPYYDSRSGTNSPYTKGGWKTETSYKTYSYVKTVGYQLIPRRRYKWVYDKEVGRRRKRYYIVHVRRPVKQRFEKVKAFKKRTWVQPERLLTSNQLAYKQKVISPTDQNAGTAHRASSSTTVSWSGDPGVVFGTYGTTSLLQTGFNSTLTLTPSSVYFDAAKEKALTNLYGKVKDEYPDYLRMAAEADKTFALLKAIVREGISVIKAIKKLQFAKLRNKLGGITSKDAAGYWLAYTYGVAPLISDVNATLKDIGREQRSWRKYSQSAKIEPTKSEYVSRNGFTSYKHESELIGFVKASCIMDSELNLPKNISVRGIDPRNFAAVGWELIPFSFMVDWLIPIGGYLSGYDSIGGQLHTFWYTTYYKHTRVQEGVNELEVDGFVPDGGTAGKVTQYEVGCQRLVSHNIPPMPIPKIDFGSALSTRRLINALAILRQLS